MHIKTLEHAATCGTALLHMEEMLVVIRIKNMPKKLIILFNRNTCRNTCGIIYAVTGVVLTL